MNVEEEWRKAQIFEKSWWLCARNQHATELEKGGIVARLMMVDSGVPTKTVLDIGCGPFSLLQTVPSKSATCLDPIHYEDLEQQYVDKGIRRLYKCGEDLTVEDGTFDEVWIYNCLQHVKNPTSILNNAISVGKTIRIFEWIHIPPYEGHLYELTPQLLKRPFNQQGLTTVIETQGFLNSSGLNGQYFMGIYSKDPDFKLRSSFHN
jgi:SAM-dependent methyltransferase